MLTHTILLGASLTGCSSGDDDAARNGLTPLPPMTSPDTTVPPGTTVPADTEPSVPSTATMTVPPFQAPDCGEVSGDELFGIVAAFRPEVDGRSGLTIALAGAIDDADGVRYIVGSIYDSTGFEVSAAQTWAVVDDEVYAVSLDAIEHSTLPDGREVLDGPDQGLQSPVRALLEACVSDAG